MSFRVTAGRAARGARQAADDGDAARWPGPLRTTHLLAVGLLTVLAAAAYSAFALATALRVLITPRVKVGTVLWLLAPFCFLPLRSPITLAAVPLLLERMLDSKFPNWWVTSFQYNAYLVIILAFAAVDGAARLDRWSAEVREYVVLHAPGAAR